MFPHVYFTATPAYILMAPRFCRGHPACCHLVAATTPPRAPVCLSRHYCGPLGDGGDGGNGVLCGFPIFGSFTAPIVNWGLLLNDGMIDRDCCYDSDNDGTLDTNANPGGWLGGGGGVRRRYSGWPKSRSSAWGNCSRPCWDMKGAGVACVRMPKDVLVCENPTQRPVCAAASPDGKGSGGSGSGSGGDDDDDDRPQRRPRSSTETSSPRTTPASGGQRLCNGKRDPHFCNPYESASECEVWELNASCPILCYGCLATRATQQPAFTRATTAPMDP